jgi:EmrB/QacA subfamily drug resistance transporter
MATASLSQPRGRSFFAARLVHGLDYKWQVLLCTVFGTFMIMLDSTIVNIALPKITSVFGVGVSEAQLVITSYMLALAVIMPATGFLGDTLGTKRLYLITMALFTGGSLLCGLAWNNPSLVAFRVIQGLGGGMMSPLGMTMLFKAVPPRERNAVMGVYGLPIILAPVLGPTVGGYLVEYVDWRVIFTLNVPVGIVGIFLGWKLLRESERVSGLTFDIPGFVLSAVAFSALLLGLSEAPTDGWTAPHILLRLGIGVAALVAWVIVELKQSEPLLELRLFKNGTFSLSMLISFVLTAGLFGSQLLVPLFLQSFRGLGAAETGLITMWGALALAPMMPLAGRLMDRVGLRPLLVVGLPLVAATTWLFSGLDVSTTDSTIKTWLVLRSVALGLVMMPSFTAAMNAAPLQLMSRASSLTNVFRQVFGAFGTALFVSILQSRQRFHAAMVQQTVTPDNLPLQQLMSETQQWMLSHGASQVQAQAAAMMSIIQRVQLTAAVMAFDDVFRIAALITLLGIVPALFLRPSKPAGGGRPIMAD